MGALGSLARVSASAFMVSGPGAGACLEHDTGPGHLLSLSGAAFLSVGNGNLD